MREMDPRHVVALPFAYLYARLGRYEERRTGRRGVRRLERCERATGGFRESPRLERGVGGSRMAGGAGARRAVLEVAGRRPSGARRSSSPVADGQRAYAGIGECPT